MERREGPVKYIYHIISDLFNFKQSKASWCGNPEASSPPIVHTLREEIFAGINIREFFFGHFAEINFREFGFTKDFAGINFRESGLTKDFAGINFRERDLYKDFAAINFAFALRNIFP